MRYVEPKRVIIVLDDLGRKLAQRERPRGESALNSFGIFVALAFDGIIASKAAIARAYLMLGTNSRHRGEGLLSGRPSQVCV